MKINNIFRVVLNKILLIVKPSLIHGSDISGSQLGGEGITVATLKFWGWCSELMILDTRLNINLMILE